MFYVQLIISSLSVLEINLTGALKKVLKSKQRAKIKYNFE